MTAQTYSVGNRPLPPLARTPVFAAMLALAVALTAVSDRYGYHRDELYFRMLRPSWGYLDQPPLAPLLARLSREILADQPWAMRIPATIATVASVLIVVLITRELGGGSRAQALSAWGYGFASLTLIIGHTLLTATLDFPIWPAIVLCIIRAQLRAEPRWWLVCGAIVGLSTYNKLLAPVLLIALAAGLIVLGPRHLLLSRWVAAGAVIAVLIALPNLLYQATNGWPQLSMGRALAAHNGSSVRVQMWPFLLLILGPPLVPIWVAGLIALLRRGEWRPVRFIAAGFPALLVLVFVMGSQFYYPFGLLAVLYAAGCVPAAEWGRGWLRQLPVAAVALNAVVSIILGLPVIPLSKLGATPVPAINQVAQDSVGWPAYVREIADVYAEVPTGTRANAVIVASNYGEAGAVARYGRRYQLPAVYSGQNQLYYEGQPPATATVAVFVGGQEHDGAELFGRCSVVARLDNHLGVDNEEQGEPIAICERPIGGWRSVWPRLRHED